MGDDLEQEAPPVSVGRVEFVTLDDAVWPLVAVFLAQHGMVETDRPEVWEGPALDDEACAALADLGPVAFTHSCDPGDGLLALTTIAAPGLFWTGTAGADGVPVLDADWWAEARPSAAHSTLPELVAAIDTRLGLSARATLDLWSNVTYVRTHRGAGHVLAADAFVAVDGWGLVQLAVTEEGVVGWRVPLPPTGTEASAASIVVLVYGAEWWAVHVTAREDPVRPELAGVHLVAEGTLRDHPGDLSLIGLEGDQAWIVRDGSGHDVAYRADKAQCEAFAAWWPTSGSGALTILAPPPPPVDPKLTPEDPS